MNTTENVRSGSQKASPSMVSEFGSRLGRRSSVLLLIGSAAVMAGAFFGRNWLAALGVAPVLLGVLPCVAICALGLCMNHASGRTCGKKQDSPEQPPNEQWRNDRQDPQSGSR